MLIKDAIILILFFTTLYLLFSKHSKKKAIQVEPHLLYKILEPGVYIGKSNYTPTEIYKNGLVCQNKLVIKIVNKRVNFTNEIIAFDKKTGKFEYKIVRIGEFYYKPNHGLNLFKSAKSYINNKIVSSSYGYVTQKTLNSITLELSGSWHISNVDHHLIKNKLIKIGNTLIAIFDHPNGLKFYEVYNKISYILT